MRAVLALLLVTTGSATAESFELGIGGGAFWGHEDIKITRTNAFHLQITISLNDKLDVVAGAETFTGNYSPEPTNEQSVIDAIGGIRWNPYGRAQRDGFEPRALYVQAFGGFSLLTLIPYDSFFESNDPDAAGVVGGAALGWTPLRLGNIAFGLEVRGNVILYNADAGFRQTLSVNAMLQINLD